MASGDLFKEKSDYVEIGGRFGDFRIYKADGERGDKWKWGWLKDFGIVFLMAFDCLKEIERTNGRFEVLIIESNKNVSCMYLREAMRMDFISGYNPIFK